MDLSEISAGTPKVLGRCLELFDQHQDKYVGNYHPLASAPVTPAKYDSNPDIQFFRLVKTKHHYNYHKSKTPSHEIDLGKIAAKSTVFNPYSRPLLLSRLSTFSALNWQIPYSAEFAELNELLCASHGWTCESISQNNNTKNHLRCTGCRAQFVLQFNTEEALAYTPFWFDADDVRLVNANLKKEYIDRVCDLAHLESCSWRKLHTPIDSVYYLTPHIGFANETLISEYLRVLFDLTKIVPRINHQALQLEGLLPPVSHEDLAQLVLVSNTWLLCRYFKEDKENFATVLGKSCPDWIYQLAAMGWDLKAQKFAHDRVLLLICTTCNNRVVLKASGTESDIDDFSSSKILSPCEFPAHLSALATSSSGDYVTDLDDEESEDVNFGHKSWCLHASTMGNVPFHHYFTHMLIELYRFVGPVGEYEDKDMAIGQEIPEHRKRQNTINVNDGLERFSKLRKLYFID